MNKVDKRCRCFLWGSTEEGKTISLVAWYKVCKAKKYGGLNIRSYKNWNLATVGKLIWMLVTNKECLWVRWIHGIYMKQGKDIWEHRAIKVYSWYWKNLNIIKNEMKYWYNNGRYILTHSGKYSMSRSYLAIVWKKTLFPASRLLWSRVILPKHGFILRLTGLKKLLTRDRITGMGLVTDTGVCVLCTSDADDSHCHIFMDYSWTKQDEAEWNLIPPLPSYGTGRDAPGPRFISLIFGTNLTDVVITGGNGTIDGQGQEWWTKFRQGQLKNTRPYLIEIMFSDHVQISNLILINSPSWNVHPVYSSFVVIKGLTILAPIKSPNTDGINPDSCSNTRIEDCFIVSGDDCIAVKSGWDEYGIAFGMPTQHLIVRNLTCISPDSAVIALGSEMSGGIQNVRAENITAISSESGLRIKTSIGRGAYMKDIFVRGMTLQTMKYTFWMTGDYGSHPDDHYDPKALPVIQGLNFKDVVSKNVTIAGKLVGVDGDTFTGICMSNVAIELSEHAKKLPWNCSNIQGVSSQVSPQPCALLPDKKIDCPFPTDTLPVDKIYFQTCAAASLH
ncbi:putative polygalacturonase [Capsicum annuum]|uniref:Polygalacturonase n=1 Tax=Capsicum annuum TaxID=4072 RepID=A0A2G2ZZH9_CAPAN|nr:putative polygalacturonase [Capsicum annuum]